MTDYNSRESVGRMMGTEALFHWREGLKAAFRSPLQSGLQLPVIHVLVILRISMVQLPLLATCLRFSPFSLEGRIQGNLAPTCWPSGDKRLQLLSARLVGNWIHSGGQVLQRGAATPPLSLLRWLLSSIQSKVTGSGRGVEIKRGKCFEEKSKWVGRAQWECNKSVWFSALYSVGKPWCIIPFPRSQQLMMYGRIGCGYRRPIL